MDPTDLPPESRDDNQTPAPPPPPESSGGMGAPAEAAVSTLPSAKSRSKIVVLTLGIVVAMLAAGTVLVVRSGTTATALDTVVPSDAIAFAAADVRPGGSQGAAIKSLLGRLSEDRRQKVIDGFNDQLEKAAREAGLNYETEVKPWVGDNIAMAVRPPGEASSRGPVPVVLLSVTDDNAARAALSKAKLDDTAFEVAGGVAYLAEKAADITSFRGALTAKGPLSERAEYSKEIDAIGDAISVAWFDGSELSKQIQGAMGGGLLPFGNTQLGDAPTGFAGLGLKATTDGFELVAHATQTAGTPPTGGEPKILESAPSDLTAALTIFDPASIVETVSNFVAGFGGGEQRVALRPQVSPFDFDNPLEPLGLDIEKDLLPWMHGELSVLIGGFSAPPIPDAAVVIEPTNDAAADRTLAKLKQNLGSLGLSVEPTAKGFNVNTGEFTVFVVREADRVIIASNAAYAARLGKADATALGADSVYTRTFGTSSAGTVFQLFVRIDRVQSLLETFLPPAEKAEYEREAKPYLDEFQSFGVRATVNGTESTLSIKLLVRE